MAAENLVAPTPTPWGDNPTSVAYDYFNESSMWFFHWGDPGGGIWRVGLQPEGSSPNQVITNKRGGQSTDGGTIRPSDGFVFVTDWEGDGIVIDDSIHLLDRSGNVIAFWETDGGLAGTPCTGEPIHMIQDVALDHDQPATLFATRQGSNEIYAVDVSNTSNGTVNPSPCNVTVAAEADVGLADVTGIEYDACHDGFWLSDYESPNVVLVDNDGTFNTVLHQFSGSSGLPWNDGVSPDFSDPEVPRIWLTDYHSGSFSVWDSGLGKCVVGDGPRQIIRIRKFFDDGNPADVLVRLDCNTGAIPDHQKWIREDRGVDFVITDFTPGELSCTVTETVPAGYTAHYAPSGPGDPDSCFFDELTGGTRTCNITNELQPVKVEVTKRWFDEHPEFENSTFARAKWQCDPVAFGDDEGSLWFSGDGDEAEFWPLPSWDGTTVCSVREKIRDSSVESDATDCTELEILPGQGAECTLVNTRIYEGIPTLRQSGLLALTIVLLLTGLWGFRRP